MSRAECCTIKRLEGEIDDLEEQNAALGEQVADLTQDLAECGAVVAALYPGEPVLLAAAWGLTNLEEAQAGPIDTTGASFLVVSVAHTTEQPLTDSFNNTWELVASAGTSPDPVHDIYIARDANTGPLHTFHYGTPGVTSEPSIIVAAFSWAGAIGTLPPSQVTATSSDTVPVTPLTGTSEKVLFLTGISTQAGSPVSVNDGFRLVSKLPWFLGDSKGNGLAYKVVDGPVVAQPVWSLDANAFSAATMITFNAAAPFPPAPLELTAWDHWILEQGPLSLTGRVTSNLLIPLAPVAWTTKSVILQGGLPGFINGLDTGLPDQSDFTICMVVKRPVVAPGDLVYFVGTDSNVSDEGGGGLVAMGATPASLTMYAWTTLLTQELAQAPWAEPGFNPGEWMFVAWRSSLDETGVHIYSANLHQISDDKIPAPNNIVIGNGYHAVAAAAKQLEVAEVIVFNSALPSPAIDDVYERSKLRMSRKGIGIVGPVPS